MICSRALAWRQNKKMKFNLVPHLCWLIAVLLAIIAFMVLRVTNGNEVNSYISFASSIASLILAVVAIFYSIVSNDSLSSSLSSIQNLGSVVREQTDNLDKSALEFTRKIEEFTPHFSIIPSRIDALGLDLQQKLESISLQDKESSIAKDATIESKPIDNNGYFFTGKVTMGVNVATYLIAISAKTDKSIDLSVIFSDNIPARNYVSGALAVIAATSHQGVKISLVNSSFVVTDFGSMNIEKVIERNSHKTDQSWVDVRRKVDSYLNSEAEVTAKDQ